MEQIERAEERLENIRSVKPILSGLRAISLGSWQAALRERSGVRAYARRLERLLPSLVPELDTPQTVGGRLRRRLAWRVPLADQPGGRAARPSEPSRVEALAVGTERGLCGRFNVAVADEAEHYLKVQSAADSDARLLTLGTRLQRVLQRRGLATVQAGLLSVATLPLFSLAFDLTHRWLEAYENRDLDAVDIIYNRYRGTGAYEPTVARLIPPTLPTEHAPSPSSGATGELAGSRGAAGYRSRSHAKRDQPRRVPDVVPRDRPGKAWPAPIIETDPHSIYAAVIEQLAAVQLYEVLLDAAAAEHSTRFQLMETATQNADQLIEELTLATQTARRQEITQELAELAAGAGLIGRK